MSAPHQAGMNVSERGLMFWLPPGGFGNEIAASAWAELADLPEDELAGVLFALTDARIAAYVAVPRPVRKAATRGPRRYRLWVDSLRYRRAEDVLMDVLAALHHTRPPTPRRC